VVQSPGKEGGGVSVIILAGLLLTECKRSVGLARAMELRSMRSVVV
jgi:hypothetical protein